MKRSILKAIEYKNLFCLITLSILFSPVKAQTAAELYKTGSDLCDKGQFEAALPYFDKAISLDPSNADFFNGRGRAYIGINKNERAIEDCNKAISMDPVNAFFFNNRGRGYYAMGLYDKAFPDFNQAVILQPKIMYSSHTSIGLIYNTRRQFDLALKAFTEAITINPSYIDAYTGRANTYSMMGKPDEAINDCNAAIKINPELPYAYYLRANQLSNKNNYEQALADYNKCIELRPKISDGYYSRGNLYSKQLQWDLALKDYTTAIQLYPNYSFALNMRALANLAKGEYEAAVTDLKQAISLDTKKQYANFVLNIIEPLARLNRFSEAATFWKQYQSGYPKGYIENDNWNYFKKYFEAITQYLAINDFGQALSTLNEADKLYMAKSGPNMTIDTTTNRRTYSSLLTLKGYILMKQKRPEEAYKAYTQSLLINSSQPDVAEALQTLSQNKAVLVKDDREAPTLNILEPANNNRSISIGTDKIAGMSQKIRGQAIDPSGIRSVQINNKPVAVEANGYFETTVPVSEGVNIFTVAVTDNNANTYVENIQLTGGNNIPVPSAGNNAGNNELKDEPRYHAILIAENNYRDNNIKSLERPGIDLNIIYDILVSRYSFSQQNVIKLFNPGRAEILETIMKKANDLKENDNLLIFYAGHGEMIKLPNNKEEGFLLPADAVKGSVTTYIRGDDLIRTFEFSKAQHILVLADACFAGSLLRNIEKEAETSVVEAYKDQSRKVMASGNRTVVPDESAFIANLRTAFLNNKRKYITAEQLLNGFKEEYTNKTHLNLQYYPIAGLDLGGQFVFKKQQ